MRLLKLAVEGYGRFRERTAFEFDAGLNVFHGGNESGKSTLLAALLDALYTLPSSTAQNARERIHWGHPHGWTLELELELRGERIAIRKFHPVDDPRKRAEFTVRIGEETLSGDAARARWEHIWQVPQEVYLATACVRQRELAYITNRNLKSLQQQLRTSAVSADLNRILGAIQQERRRLRAQIDQQEQATQSLETRLRTVQHAERQRQNLRAQQQRIETESAQLRPQLEADEQLLARWRSSIAQQERLERLRREADANQRHLDTLEQLERRVRALETELQTQFADWDALPTDFKEQLDAAYLRYQDAVRRLHTLSEAARRHRVGHQQARGRTQARRGFAVLGTALLIASAPLWGVSPMLGGVALTLGLVALGVALLWRKPSDSAPSAEPALQHAQAEAQAHWQTLAQRLREAGYTLETPPANGATEPYGAHLIAQLQRAVQQFSERWNTLHAQRAALDAAHRQIDALHAVQDPKALRERQRELAIEILGLQEQLQRDPLAREELSAESLMRLEAQVERARRRLAELHAEQLRGEGAFANLPDAEPADAVALEHERALQRLHHLQYRHRLLETAELLLSEANAQYLSNLSPRLKPRIETYLPTLTLARYTQADLDETLRLQVHHPERGEILLVEEGQPAWSAGVLDQLFFACRLGLADALADDLRLPLLLDDPFLHFDAERYRAALELLQRVATQTQATLFTCRALPEGIHAREFPL